MAAPHVGDVGFAVTLTVKNQDDAVIDLSTASAKSWTIRRPNGSTTTWAPSFVTDGTDGQLTYSTIAGDLSEAGLWLIQVNLTFAGWSAKSDPAGFYVDGNL